VTYIALGHCSPASQNQPTADSNPDAAAASPALRGITWESDAYTQLLRNATAWRMD